MARVHLGHRRGGSCCRAGMRPDEPGPGRDAQGGAGSRLQVQPAARCGARHPAGHRRGGAARALRLPALDQRLGRYQLPEEHHRPVGGRASGGAQHSNVEFNPRGYTVGLVQPLFRGFRTVNAVNAAEATVRAGWETLRIAEASVLLEAVTAYGDVVRDTAIVRLRENNVTVLTRDLRATQDRFNVGEVTRTDVAQAQARRAAAVAALDLARANLKTSRATFERVVGHPPSHLVEARATNLVAEDRPGEHRDLRAREPDRGRGALSRAGRALRRRSDPRRAAADRAARGQLHQALRSVDRSSTRRRPRWSRAG